MCRFTVVIPTYNEKENLPDLVAEILALNQKQLDVLIVDDASPDGTGQIAEQLALQTPGRVNILHRNSKKGLGTAYIEGFKWAIKHGAKIIIQMDADFSHSPRYIADFLLLIANCDVVIGSRYVDGGSIHQGRSTARNWLSWWANAVFGRMILENGFIDATSGFRCWRSSALEKIGLDCIRSKGYVFQVEMCYAAEKSGLRIKETPIHFGNRRNGKSKMSFWIQTEALWRFLIMRFPDTRCK